MPQQPKLHLIESHGLYDCCSLISGPGKIGPTRRPPPTRRSLVVETEDSITLIDPGLSLFDWLAPERRLGIGASWRLPRRQARGRILRPLLEQRGMSPDRVGDIVVTHMHPDVIGAISDFPKARIHALPHLAHDLLHRPAQRALPQFAHRPEFVPPLEPTTRWSSFARQRLRIEGLELYLLELPGHTMGHAGVLIRSASGFVLYLGDAIGSLEELTATTPPAGPCAWLRILGAARPFDGLVTRDRLRRLLRCPPAPLTFILARDPSARFSVGPGPYPSIGYL